MIIRSNFNGFYVGPKALFDPNYIPPRLLHRKKEERSLFSVLKDSITDDFCLNILYQGIDGIGKRAIVNKVLNEILTQNQGSMNIHKACVDCKEKNFEELIFSLMTELSSLSNFNCNVSTILNSNISQLWNIFKLACKKNKNQLYLVFNNVEYLDPKVFNKFLQFGKETNTTLIFTVNKILRPKTIDVLTKFDLRKKLSFFTYHELYSILKQRVLLAFPHEIDKEIIKYIADVICEQYVPVPGKGIEILRDIYPILKPKNRLNNYELIEICQNHFDAFQISDEFSMLNYISEEDPLNIIFLDNLSNFFMRSINYYISLKELQDLYEITCESLEYEKSINEFQELTKELLNLGIIRPSRKNSCKEYTSLLYDTTDYDYFFMVINPRQLKAIIDTLFNK